jgi:hypothetical protein
MTDFVPGIENACFRRHFLHGLANGYAAICTFMYLELPGFAIKTRI